MANPDWWNEFMSLMQEDPGDNEQAMANLRQAAALADTHGDVPRGFRARMALIHLTQFGGREDESLVHFVWCLGACEKIPQLFEVHQHDVLWYFKWIADVVCQFHTISRQQIDETMARMVQYYDKAGSSHRAIHCLRAKHCIWLGENEKIAAHRDAWLESPEDGSEDCSACEASNLVDMFLATGEREKALQSGAGLVEGFMRCAEQPQNTQSVLLVPLLHMGKSELAEELQLKSSPKIKGQPECLMEMGHHVGYLALTWNLTKSVKMLEAGLRQLRIVRCHHKRMLFFNAGRILMERLAERKNVVKLAVPADVPFRRDDETYPVAELHGWFEGEAVALAAAFDARNGNAAVSRGLRADDELLARIKPEGNNDPA